MDQTVSFPFDPADLPSASIVAARPGRVSIAAADRPGPSAAADAGAEAGALLQRRLRAATIVLLGAFGMYFARSLWFRRDEFPIAHGLMLAAYAGGAAALARRRALPVATLRALEVATFWLTAAVLLLTEYASLLELARAGDSAGLPMAGKRFAVFAFALVVTYGMLIPNTWRRAALIVAPAALAPIFAGLLLRLTHPELGRFTREVATPEQVSDDLLILLIGASLAIFGTHVINTLRVEATEARQLAQYRLGERLGAGGMGEVYRAEHRLMKRPCAIKLVRREIAGDPAALARFEREVRATATLSHPNTIEIYDFGRTEEGAFYYVMEFLPGLSLAELIERHGPMPAGRTVYLLRQACDALGEAHAAGLVHRDLKPANLFCAYRGGRCDVTKVLDFGLVQAPAEPGDPLLSRVGTIRGTPQYMAPEQVAGDRRIDARCDLYALGAVAFELLTGRPPFSGPSPYATMASQLSEPPPSPSRLRADVPADLEAVILRCLSKLPADRPASAADLEAALAACSCASDWDAHRAEDWWRDCEPGRLPGLERGIEPRRRREREGIRES